MAVTNWREPLEIVAGDTLAFSRVLPDYSSNDGWGLVYELRGGSQPIEFTSTADNGNHAVSVGADVTATWLPGDYILAGYAVKSTLRHQIFYSPVPIRPNLPATAGDEPQKTFAQKMAEAWEQILLNGGTNDLVLSQVGGQSRFQYMTAHEKRTEHGYWIGVRRQEVALEKAKMGMPTGNKIRPRFNLHGGIGVNRSCGGYLGW